jgi:hypothetical protein
MTDEFDLIYSDLQTSHTADGHTVGINIYKLPETEWVLEIVDEFNNSTVWDDSFLTDEAALAEALQAIKDEGISAFVGQKSS